MMNGTDRNISIIVSALKELYNIIHPEFQILYSKLLEAMIGNIKLTPQDIENLLNHYGKYIFLLNGRQVEYLRYLRINRVRVRFSLSKSKCASFFGV